MKLCYQSHDFDNGCASTKFIFKFILNLYLKAEIISTVYIT